jgi:hypothetical protein
MKKHLFIFIVIVNLAELLCGCSSQETSNGMNSSGYISINVSTYSKDISQGEIADYPLIVENNIINNSAITVRASPASGDKWKFALCYGSECFMSDGFQIIEKNINLSPNSSLDFEIKVFAPDQIKSGDGSTIRFEVVSSSLPKATYSVRFTTTAK